MRYSRHQREAFVEALAFIGSGDALRHLLSIGAAEVKAGAAIGRSIHPYRAQSVGSEAVGACLGLAFAACHVSVGMGLWALARMASLLLGKARRPRYYPRERSRRARLARERRRVRDRFTIAPCPDPGQLLAQYAKAKTGAREALAFGSMLCDLEAYCDNSLVRNVDGEITGRNPGMKGWIRENCPELLAHYKNAMRYKGLAEKFRQAAGAADPVPAAALAADDGGEVGKLLGGKRIRKITVRMRKANGPRDGKTVSGTYALDAEALEAARKCAREILRECEGEDPDRLRCGKTMPEDGTGEETARPLCGKTMPEDGRGEDGTGEETARLRCGNGRGEVARLERILEERLGGVPEGAYAASRWRVGGTAANGGGVNGSGLASA